MREMKINQVTGGVRVELVGVGHEKDVLLETLGSCADGSCACSSTEYEKVQSLQISSSADDITLDIAVKPGETIDAHCINECIDAARAESRSTPA